MNDETRDAPGTGAPRPEWDEVIAALSALGYSIGRATMVAVDDDENRRRLRELRQGLEVLAKRLGESAGEIASSPAAEKARDAVVDAALTVAAAGERIVEEVRPDALEAFRLANAKFKQAADSFDKPVAPAGAPVADAQPRAASVADLATQPSPFFTSETDAPSSIPAGEPAPTTLASLGEPAAPVPSPAGVSPGLIDAVRATNERFRAERKAAVEAAAAASSLAALAADAEPIVPGAAEPSEGPAEESTPDGEEDFAEDAALDGPGEPMAHGSDDGQELAVAQDPPTPQDLPEYSTDPATGERNAPAPAREERYERSTDPATGEFNASTREQEGLFDFDVDDEGEDGARPSAGGFDLDSPDDRDSGSGDGYTP